jgi:predicted CoA-binding protein
MNWQTKRPLNNQEAQDNIAALFDPQSVAVIGSFKESWFGGYIVAKQLQDFGFSGRIYPIKPNYDTAQLPLRARCLRLSGSVHKRE